MGAGAVDANPERNAMNTLPAPRVHRSTCEYMPTSKTWEELEQLELFAIDLLENLDCEALADQWGEHNHA